MDCQPSRELVIDACVLQAAGGDQAQHPTSKNCRDFLTAVLELCHRVVVSPLISEEWKKHRSKASNLWLKGMFARKKVRFVPVAADSDLRRRVEKLANNPHILAIVGKDMLLVECALQSDKRIVSIDQEVRPHLNSAALVIKELRKVAWVNPAMEHENPIGWLEAGAPLERSRLLGGGPAVDGSE